MIKAERDRIRILAQTDGVTVQDIVNLCAYVDKLEAERDRVRETLTLLQRDINWAQSSDHFTHEEHNWLRVFKRCLQSALKGDTDER